MTLNYFRGDLIFMSTSKNTIYSIFKSYEPLEKMSERRVKFITNLKKRAGSQSLLLKAILEINAINFIQSLFLIFQSWQEAVNRRVKCMFLPVHVVRQCAPVLRMAYKLSTSLVLWSGVFMNQFLILDTMILAMRNGKP